MELAEIKNAGLVDDSLQYARVRRNAAWSLTTSVGAKLCAVVAMLLTAKILGRSAFGDFGVAQSSLALMAAISSLGIGATACKHIATYRDSDLRRASASMSLAMLVAVFAAAVASVLLFAGAGELSQSVLRRPQLARALEISAIALFFQILNGAQIGVLAGLEQYRRIAELTLAAAVIRLVAMASGAWLGGVEGCLWGLAICNVAICLLFRIRSHPLLQQHRLQFRFKDAISEWHMLGRFSLPVVLCDFLILGSQWIAIILLTRSDPGAREVGAFTLAQQIGTLVLLVPGAVSSTLLPVFSHTVGMSGLGQARRILIRMSAVNFLASSIAAVVAVGCFPIVNWTLDNQYNDAFAAIGLMAVTYVLIATAGTVGSYMQARSHVWIGAAICLCQSAVLVIGTKLLASYGAYGVASAYLASYIVHLSLVAAYIATYAPRERDTDAFEVSSICTSST